MEKSFGSTSHSPNKKVDFSAQIVGSNPIVHCSILPDGVKIVPRTLSLKYLHIQSCGKVRYICQHIVLGTFMTVSRVLPSYPPTYHTREVIPTDS